MSILIILIFGLEFGSFANVCIYRWPRQQSIVTPIRSFCPWCHETIRWWQNIPVLSFFFLRGRCYFCRSAIAPRYLFVELAIALLWVTGTIFIDWKFEHVSWPFLIALFVFMFVVVVASVADWEWKIIPDQSCLLLFLWAIATAAFNPLFEEPRIVSALLGAVAGVFLMFMVSVVGRWLFGRDALGQGDIKLMGAVGSFLGWKGVLAATFFGSFAGALFVFAMFCFRRARPKQMIPFGPFLNLGALLQFFVGERFLERFFF